MSLRTHSKVPATSLAIISFTVVAVFAGLYIANIVKFSRCDFEAPFKCEVLHGAGLLPPLAPFTVWFGDDS